MRKHAFVFYKLLLAFSVNMLVNRSIYRIFPWSAKEHENENYQVDEGKFPLSDIPLMNLEKATPITKIIGIMANR